MFKLFDTMENVKMQIQKKRRQKSFGGMWGSAMNFWGRQSPNQGNNNGWPNTQHNQGNWNQGNNGWGQQPNINETGLAMALIGNQSLWGNNLDGPAWIKEQNMRQSFNILQSGQGAIRMNDLKNILEEQITFLQPSPAQKKIAQLKMEGKQFYDDRFPPNNHSLHGNSLVPQWRDIQWKKISDLMPNAQIFKGKIEPDDIKQGYLGDCYFLAALAALSERPDRIFSLFLTKQKNLQKYYSVKLLYKGKWMTIDMDQYIPVLYGKPAFTKAKDDELWVILLQKAWAKLYKNYKQIEAGFSQEGLHDLTGAPIHQIYFKTASFDRQKQWNYLLMASAKQYSMVASSQPGSDTQTSVSGIVQGHAYTFLNATILTYQGGQDRVVQLRNPWGKGQSKGKWADNDPNWHRVSPQEKQRIGYNNDKDDGKFFMTYEAFLQQFRALTVAQINDNASYIYKSMKDKQINGVYFKIQIVQQGYYSLQVDKTPERDFDQFLQNKYRYPKATLSIGRMQNGRCHKLESFASMRRTLFKGYELNPGVYIAFVKVDFDSKWEKQYDINLAIYAEYVCDIEIASRQQAIAFTGNPNINWQPSQHINNQSWNSMGNSKYIPGNSGWGNDNGWGNNGSNNNNGWGNNGSNNNNGWGNNGNNNNGWGNNGNNNNGWGNNGNNNNGWGNNGNNNNGWGNNGNNNNGWGNNGGNNGGNNNNGWGNTDKKDDGWGNYFNKQPSNNNSHNNGWGNNSNSQQNQSNDGWGNYFGNNKSPNNSGGNNQGPNSSWGPGW